MMTSSREPDGGMVPAPADAGPSRSPSDRPGVVTIAALYGAGGSVIGSRAAEQLGVEFLDRAILHEVAQRTGVPEGALGEVDDQPRSLEHRLFAMMGRASTLTGGHGTRLDLDQRDLRGQVEKVLARVRVSGGVVIGRGGMVVLRTVPWALHVLLTGPTEDRIGQAMAAEEIDRTTARRRQQRTDRARIEYVRSAYGVDGNDPRLYHLVLDATSLDPDACVDLIVRASRARSRRPRHTPTI
jgi:cytidylate kinase